MYILWWNQRVFHRRDARHALLEELSHAQKMRPLRSGDNNSQTPANTDAKGAIESIRTNGVSVLSGLNVEKT